MKNYKISQSITKSLTTIQPNNIRVIKDIDTDKFIINGELIIKADLSKPFKIDGRDEFIKKLKLVWGAGSKADQNIVSVKKDTGQISWEISNFEEDFASLGLHPYFISNYNDEIRYETKESKAKSKFNEEKGIFKIKEIKHEYKGSKLLKKKYTFQAPLKHKFENTITPVMVDYYLLIAELEGGSEFLYNARQIYDSSTILGSNASNVERAFYLTGKRLTELPVQLSELTQPFGCEAAFLPWLSWGVGGLGWYNDQKSDEDKLNRKEVRNRHNIFNTPKIYGKKGTISSIKLALSSIGINKEDIKIIEWHSESAPESIRGKPFWFQIQISLNLDLLGQYSDDFENQTMQLIENTKPARTHFIKSTICSFEKNFNTACIGEAIERVNLSVATELPEETLNDWINLKSEMQLSTSLRKTEFINFQSSIVLRNRDTK